MQSDLAAEAAAEAGAEASPYEEWPQDVASVSRQAERDLAALTSCAAQMFQLLKEPHLYGAYDATAAVYDTTGEQVCSQALQVLQGLQRRYVTVYAQLQRGIAKLKALGVTGCRQAPPVKEGHGEAVSAERVAERDALRATVSTLDERILALADRLQRLQLTIQTANRLGTYDERDV